MTQAKSDIPNASSGSQALTRGLDVLRVLAESPEPLSSKEIARRVGLHQSWASRILKTLIGAGYVRKLSYHSFGIDYGILCLGGIAAKQFKFTTRPLAGLQNLLTVLKDGEFSLGCLWDNQIIYFFRLHYTQGYSPAAAGFFAFHDSKIALRLLLEQDDKSALAALEGSIRRYGISEKRAYPFSTAQECLQQAKDAYDPQTGCLYIDNPKTSMTGGAILVNVPGEPLSVLALNGSMKTFSREFLTVTLHQAKHLVEEAMTTLK